MIVKFKTMMELFLFSTWD